MPLLVFVGVRVYVSLAVYLVAPLIPLSTRPSTWSALPQYPLLEPWTRWDSIWYAEIALEGYRFLPEQASNIAFFPLYPLAVKLLAALAGNVWVSGLLISNLAFLGALIVLYKLTELKLDAAAAGRTVLYVASFPAAFYFYSMYTESVYLLAVVATFYLLEKKRGWWAGTAGGLAALTRPMGILLFLAGAAHSVARRGLGRPWPWRGSVPLLFIPLALAGFLVYSHLAFGEALAFLKSRVVGWEEPVSLFPVSHQQLAATIFDGSILRGEGSSLRIMDAAWATAFLALTVPVFRRLGPSYGLYALGSLAMPLLVTLDGLTRYSSVVFPVFMIAASWRLPRALIVPPVLLSLGLLGLLASMFARWYFVG
ncbi:MAG TPA: mannosyltransferase family protein [Dehalococcoidia bacterium]|nr:mannosyltransferase family protein [Dehalococcoidia bacterium]